MQRPIDVLNNAKGKRIIVRLKKGDEISGILHAMDLHLNMWLEDAEILNNKEKIKLGRVLIRGDSVVFVSPQKVE